LLLDRRSGHGSKIPHLSVLDARSRVRAAPGSVDRIVIERLATPVVEQCRCLQMRYVAMQLTHSLDDCAQLGRPAHRHRIEAGLEWWENSPSSRSVS
jgi:hypothetical protein